MLVIRTLPIALFLLVFSTGCTPPPAAEGPSVRTLQLDDKDVFIDRTLTVLREMDLPPRFVDRKAGLIETRRTTGGQWFEPWRQDVRGSYQTLESSLQTIGRTVSVRMEPAVANPGEFAVTVDVRKERFSAPERQITTASGALGIYNEDVPTYAGLLGPRSINEQWVEIGRDPLLEEYLLDKMDEISRRP